MFMSGMSCKNVRVFTNADVPDFVTFLVIHFISRRAFWNSIRP